jgi:hypothetical protein
MGEATAGAKLSYIHPGSPQSRGRIVRRAFANPERLDPSQRGMRCSLSLGEGQGEGERDAANPNGRTKFASSARSAPRLCNPGYAKTNFPTCSKNDRGKPPSALVFRAFLPPHPALSLRERENRPPLRGESNARGRAGVSAFNRGPHGASGSDLRLEKHAGCPFPLPWGEGEHLLEGSERSLPFLKLPV